MAAIIQPEILDKKRKPHLFLSHSSKNKDIVRKLANDLNICEIDVWLDVWEINLGDSLYDKLSEAIEASKYIAIIISKEFNESQWGKSELKQAIAREMRIGRNLILPILIDNARIPSFLEDKIYIDISDDYYGGICKIAGVIHSLRTRAIDEGIGYYKPQSIRDCIRVLRYAGFEPYVYIDKEIFDELIKNGGIPYKENKVRFNPKKMLEIANLNPRTRNFLNQIMNSWRTGI